MKNLFTYSFFSLFLFSLTSAATITATISNDTTRIEADSIMKSIHNEAFKERDLGRYENAEKLYREVIRLKLTYAPYDTFKIANVYQNYASLLSLIWRYDDALYYYEKALEMCDKEDEESMLLILLNKGTLLLMIKDVSTALNYFNQAEKILNRSKIINPEMLKNVYYNKSSSYYFLNKKAESLQLLEKIETLDETSKKEKLQIEINKFILFTITSENEKAEEIYKRLTSSDLPKDLRIRLLLEYASYLYVNHSKLDDAIKIYLYLISQSGETTLKKAELLQIYNNLGNCYETKKMYKEALETYQKALIYLYPGFTNNNIKTDPPPALIYEEAQNMLLFINKAEVLYKYSKSLHDTSYLNPSLVNSMRSVNVIQKMRYRISSEQSQFIVSKNERTTFNLTQYIALENYENTKDRKYLNLAFEVNEKGRAFTLLSVMRNQKAMTFGDLPEKLRRRESELNWKLSFYDELLYKEKLQKKPDQTKISNWEDLLFKANTEYSSLILKMGREYPEYYRLKYDEKVTNLDDVQKKIDKNTVLVEYCNLDSILIIYTASRNKIAATRVRLQPGFEDKCIQFLKLITSQQFSNNANDSYIQYINLGYELYSVLIEPIKDQLDGENLIVIPEGAISYLPFDALLSAKVPEGPPDYMHVPFLVKDYSIGYAFSTTIHFNPIQHVRIPSESILAFAPIYADVGVPGSVPDENTDDSYLNLKLLRGVAREVNNISKIMKTDAYYSFSAKESAFKETAGKYNILHLATHTIIDNDNPMLSEMVFTQIPDGGEDGLLHTYEVYNMKLNANLAVLSACSSGFGKIQPGEGVQSLARSFAYAGCPSIMMTLWEVQDFSAVSVMTNFYRFLDKHLTKPQALRKSKLLFLNGSDELASNPFFWGSFVIIGDASPIFPFDEEMAGFSVFILLLPLGLLRIYYKKYRKEEKEELKAA